MKPIAICQNKKIFDHYASWTPRFIYYCEEKSIPYEVIDCYQSDIIFRLKEYSALVWHYSNFVISDLLEARNIIKVAENMGLVTFPSSDTGWHFDDKIAEMYAFNSIEACIPQSWVFYLEDECVEWLRSTAQYPLVAKLRCGSGANNVKLLNNVDEAIKYCRNMFGKGCDPSPSIAYKAYSKLQSSKDIKTALNRIKKIPQFLNTRHHAKMMPIEKGYCYFQEFVPNAGYDLKVVVINDKMTFCARNIRKNDFRASGGGDCFYDKSLLTPQIIDSAFEAAKRLNMTCVGFDFVVDSYSGKGKIIEMCYGFDYEAQKSLGGYVDRGYNWHNEAVCVPDEIIKAVVKRVKREDENSVIR